MKKLLWLLVITVISISALANQRYQGVCAQSGNTITSGLTSTTTSLRTYLGATVTVNVVGGGIATIFSDNIGTPLANPFTASGTDATFSFYAANTPAARYSVTCSGTGIPTISVNPDVVLYDPAVAIPGVFTTGNFSGNVTIGGTLGVTGPTTLSSTLAVTGASTQATVNNVCVVDGVTHAQTDAGIQACVNAVADGGMVFMPQGTYTITGTVTVAKRITVQGAGWGTILQVGAGVGATTDIFLLMPSTSSDVQGMRLQDFYITPASGTPGRSGIMVDGTNASVANLVIDHVRIDALGSYAFNIQNVIGVNSSVNGTPYLATIRDCQFSGGVNLTNVGDSINLLNNKLGGARDLLVKQIGAATTAGGAHGLMIVNNNITQTGGIVIQNAWQGLLAYNDIEMPVATTEANSALVDIQGNASANVENFKIVGNYLGATTGNVTDTIRIDRATATEIFINFTPRSTGVAYRITANAIKTHIVHDRQAPDTTINNFLADLGTSTLVEYADSGTGFKVEATNLGLAMSTPAGAIGVALTNNQVRVNPTNGAIGFTSGVPASTALDTVAWRGAANQWVFGNAFGDTSGTLLFASAGLVENGAPSGVAGRDVCYGDSVAHALECSYNNAAFSVVPLQGRANTFTGTNSFSQQITSTLATGTAPLSIASTTPVANLTVQNCGATCAITQPTISTGVSQGSGLKHQRFGVTCTTAAAANAACNTTYTWTSAFANANYTVVCSPLGAASGIPLIQQITNVIAASFDLTIIANSAVAAQLNGVQCIATHD